MNTDDIERQLETAAREHNRTVDVDTQWWRLQHALTRSSRPTRTRERGPWLVPVLAAGATLVVAAGAIGIGAYSRTAGHGSATTGPAAATSASSRPTQLSTPHASRPSTSPSTSPSVTHPAYSPPPRGKRPEPALNGELVTFGPVAPHASPDRLALTPSPPQTYAALDVSYNCSMLSTPAGALFPRSFLDGHLIVNRQPLTPPKHADLWGTYGEPCQEANKQGAAWIATYHMSSVILTAQARHQASTAAGLSSDYEFVGYRYDGFQAHRSATVTAAVWDRGNLYSMTMPLRYVAGDRAEHSAWAGEWNPAAPPQLKRIDNARGFTSYIERP